MNREDIIRMAKEAGFEVYGTDAWYKADVWITDGWWLEELERFAELVRAAEREACAKVVEDYCGAWDDGGYALAATIRVRGMRHD